MYGGGSVLGAATTATAAIVLPNTGSNPLMAAVASISLVVGVLVTTTTLARLAAKKAFKA